MTAGIAQVLALAGLPVRLCGNDPDAVARNLAFARRMIARQAEKGVLCAAAASAAAEAIVPANGLAGLADCSLVIESMLAEAEQTRACLRRIEEAVPPGCIIALNTSAHTVTELSQHAGHPERIVGLHFFDPVPLMRVVEVIPGLRTGAAALAAGQDIVARIGHRAVVVRDSPGFVVNLIGRALPTEALHITQERIASPQTIDAIVRASLGLRMGPFELLDLIGLDVSAATMQRIYDAFQQEPRLRPTPELALRVAAGLLGRKTEAGYYPAAAAPTAALTAAPADSPAAMPPTQAAALPTVWIDPADGALHTLVATHLEGGPARVDTSAQPGPDSLCLIMPLGLDATTCALRKGLDPTRTVAVDACFPLQAHATLMAPPVIQPAMQAAAIALFTQAGPASWIGDSAGFVAQRILAAIVNLGCEAAQQGLAAPADIDLAVQSALSYPQGPLAMGEAFGPQRVAAVLHALHEVYQDPRYRCSPWLRRRALLETSLSIQGSAPHACA